MSATIPTETPLRPHASSTSSDNSALNSLDEWAAEVMRLCDRQHITVDMNLAKPKMKSRKTQPFQTVHRQPPPPPHPPQAPALNPRVVKAVPQQTEDLGANMATIWDELPPPPVSGVVHVDCTGQPQVQPGPVDPMTPPPSTSSSSLPDGAHSCTSSLHSASFSSSASDTVTSSCDPTPTSSDDDEEGVTELTPAMAVRVPPALLYSAYRCHVPCLGSHLTDETKNLNCAASPLCLAGMAQLQTHASALEQCVNASLGIPPYVYPNLSPQCSMEDMIQDFMTARRAWSNPMSSKTNRVMEEVGTVAVTTTGESNQQKAPLYCLWRGLKNLSNTCYFNSVVQLMFSIGSVRRAILSSAELSPGEQELRQSGLRELFAQMAFSRDGNNFNGVDPTSFCQFLSLNPSVQQDAQEFFALLVDWMQTKCGKTVKKAVDRAFGGALLYNRRCGACGREAKRAEPFLFLTLPVKATLQESLENFLKPDEVEGFTCEGCNQTATATSYQYLRSLPDVLVMHLNRFEFDLRTLQRRKVNMNVGLPRELDMSPFMQAWHTNNSTNKDAATATSTSSSPNNEGPTTLSAGDDLYELRGVVNHISESAMSGHYVFDGKVRRQLPRSEAAKEEDMWLRFNDEETTKCSQYSGNTVASRDAYLLIYCRKPKSPEAATMAATTTTATTATTALAHPEREEGNSPNTSPTDNTSKKKPIPAAAAAAAAVVAPADNWSAPTTHDFPDYLITYMSHINEKSLEDLRRWKAKKVLVTKAMQKWAVAANAVFNSNSSEGKDANKNAKKTTASAGGGGGAAAASAVAALKEYVALPTKWLQSFGRCFLPPFIDVKQCNVPINRAGGTGDVYDVETNVYTSGTNPTATTTNPLADETVSNDTSSCASPLTKPGPATGTLLAMSSSSCFRQEQTSMLAEGVKKHPLSHAAKSLCCPHNRLAPWAEYKLVSSDAYQKIEQFLQYVEEMHKPQAQQEEARAAQAAANKALTAADRLRSLTDKKACRSFYVDKEGTHLCPACCASEAACILQWSDVFETDQNMFKLLVDAPGNAGSGSDFFAKQGESGHRAGSTSPSRPSAGAQAEETLVYVSEYVAAAWERLILNLKRWKDLVQREGYTAAYMLRRTRLEPNATLMAGATSADVAAGASSITSRHVASHTFRELVQDSLYGGDELYTARYAIACPHGFLKPTAEVRVVPDILRRYWIQRIPDILSEEAVFEASHYFSSTRMVDNVAMSRLLPYFPVETTLPCEECFTVAAAANTASTIRVKKLEVVELKKRFPTLWKAGMLTSPEAVRRLMVTEDISSVEQYITAHHPNRAFFKSATTKKHHELNQAWRAEQEAKIKAQEHTLEQLRQQHEEKKNADAHWKAVTRGGRRGNNNSSNNNAGHRNASAAAAAVNSQADEKALQAQIQEATAALEALRCAKPPQRTLYTGCVPTWWVAQWYKSAAQETEEATFDAPVAELTYDAFLCPHGGSTAELPWLNPADPFWHVERTKRAASLFGRHKQEDGAAAAAAPPPPPGPSGQMELMCQWFPPLILVPWEEFTELLRSIGKGDLLSSPSSVEKEERTQAEEGKREEEEEAPATGTAAAAAVVVDAAAAEAASSDADVDVVVPKEGAPIVYVADVGGERKLCPATCLPCVQDGLAAYENKICCFENGSLHLNVHIRKSKKSYHDATSVLLSEEVEGGLQYKTTVAQLRAALVDHIVRHHHLAVVGADLEVLRKRKPLQRVATVAAAAAEAAPVPVPAPEPSTAAAPPTTETSEDHVDPASLADTSSPNTATEDASSAAGAVASSSVEEATLQEVGVLDGDTLNVNYTERVAPYMAPAAGDVSEEWEAIPPELLDPTASHVAAEHKTAFGDTRFAMNSVPASTGVATAVMASGGAAGAAVAEEERGVACSVCTFLNAPGMVVCEMCEAPLPTH